MRFGLRLKMRLTFSMESHNRILLLRSKIECFTLKIKIMCRNVICVGTIWDLDDAVYPELDEFTGMTSWNFHQVMMHQLSSSRKEMSDVVKMPLFPRNEFGIRIRTCCASCMFKEVVKDGRRICALHHKNVEALEKCKCWQMADALQKVGGNNK